MSRLLREATSRRGKTIAIYIAEEVTDKGYRRLVDAIDPEILEKTTERVQNALQGKKLLTKEQEQVVASALITSMEHKSQADHHTHSSLELYDENGNMIAKAHVTRDKEKQAVFHPPLMTITRVKDY
ncbi:uncharacterized protein PpBr36_11322 [Pyricularia pennisetigena]|uniref:uncharacterized protein n=1 Tax=Pyricularia pennisetigena TaxID=1578925 RepID=UPI00114DA601|nr:uncharacterized protein PpBr36_11322 [Pyricularia pennisetigena]TLS20315.1 hypothetical protein PpBr36_11322 [Pyricularia pennisetigena]